MTAPPVYVHHRDSTACVCAPPCTTLVYPTLVYYLLPGYTRVHYLLPHMHTGVIGSALSSRSTREAQGRPEAWVSLSGKPGGHRTVRKERAFSPGRKRTRKTESGVDQIADGHLGLQESRKWNKVEKAGFLGFRVAEQEYHHFYHLLSLFITLRNTPEQTHLESRFATFGDPPRG